MYNIKNLTSDEICDLAASGRLREIEGGLTGQELLQHKNDSHTNALFAAIRGRCLRDVRGGMSAGKLGAAQDGFSTALHVVASLGIYDQVRGPVTVRQLAAAKWRSLTSALHEAAFCGKLDFIPGGVTAEELRRARTDINHSALCSAALGKALDQIRGGVTATVLQADANLRGCTALHTAVLMGVQHQICGGIPAAIKRKTNWDLPLGIAIDQHIVQGIKGCLELGASKHIFARHLKQLGKICAELPASAEDFQPGRWPDLWFKTKADVLRYVGAVAGIAQDLNLSELIPVEITIALL